MLYSFRSFWQRARVRAVLPDPTGLWTCTRERLFYQRYLYRVPANANCESPFLEVACAVIRHVAFSELSYSAHKSAFIIVLNTYTYLDYLDAHVYVHALHHGHANALDRRRASERAVLAARRSSRGC